LWKRYYKGERGLFARQFLEVRELDKVRERYRGNNEFRRYVDRYIADFEKILADARGAEHEELLTTAFVTADVGKIFILLREALGKSGATP
jgi:hypothetical protein